MVGRDGLAGHKAVFEVVLKLAGKLFGELGAAMESGAQGVAGDVATIGVKEKKLVVVFAGEVVAEGGFVVLALTVLEEDVTPGQQAEVGGVIFVGGVPEEVVDSPANGVVEGLVKLESLGSDSFGAVGIKGQHFDNLFSTRIWGNVYCYNM